LTQLVYCVSVAFTVTERADHTMRLPILQLSYRLFFGGKASHHPGLSALLQPMFGFLRLPAFPKAKIAFENDEVNECDGHTVHKLGQRRLKNKKPIRLICMNYSL
jgi:hypothetical protein